MNAEIKIKFDPIAFNDITIFLSKMHEYFVNDVQSLDIIVPNDCDVYFLSNMILRLENAGYFLSNVNKDGTNTVLFVEWSDEFVD